MKRTISINGPESRGAPYPRFNPTKVNESRFPDGERCKEAYLMFDSQGRSEVEWLSQEESHHSSEWENEIRRAFKAIGAKDGQIIDVKFGSRDTDFIEDFEIVI